ncbi:MAG: hypothetical protein NT171_00860 [Planctomycetota bacterium]|nr:hypothetical protein [Planctomycetota bacterium]
MAVLIAGVSARPARAVVIDRVNAGSANTTAPADDPGWNNVGGIGIGAGVYLGYGWVLTAGHIGSGAGINLGGVTYTMAPGTGHQLTNAGAAGKSTLTDLYMFQLQGALPNLPAIRITSIAPANGDTVTMIGRGSVQEANRTFWNVNDSSTPWVWTETTAALATDAGYKTIGGGTMRWGTNAIDYTDWFSVGADVFGLGTTFDPGVSNNEAQVVVGDSGGAVFVKQAGAWSLAGIIIAQGMFPQQPGGTSTAVFFGTSYFADLSYYRPQIMALAVPEPAAMTQLLAASGIGVGVWSFRRRRAG